MNIQKTTLAAFLFFWLIYAAAINQTNLNAFTLQQMGPDAIVSHQTFTLGYSEHPKLQPAGDTFPSEKGILAAKQPGQATFGALAYAPLKALNISYEKDYLFAAALTTWFSTGLIAALSVTVFYYLLTDMGIRRSSARAATFTLGIGSFWLVYSGVAHHDIIAAAFLILALFFLQRRAAAAGFFLGLAVYTSMLPALIVSVIAGYGFLFNTKGKDKLLLLVGFAAGIAPLLLYNSYYFGNPLQQANVAGNYTDTFFNFSTQQFLHHLNAYYGWGGISLLKFTPALFCGIIGLFFIRNNKIKWLSIAIFVIHSAYITNIETLGTCSYGPRYLIPLLPFFAIGLASLMQYSSDLKAALPVGTAINAILYLCIGWGTWVSINGLLKGAMGCDLNNFPAQNFLPDAHLFMTDFPLIRHSILLALMGFTALFHKELTNWVRKNPAP